MDFNSILGGVLSNAIWWILGIGALALVWFFRRTRTFWRAIPFAVRLRREGVRRFLFSRHEYPERLDAYLERAQHSIKVISISFRLTNNECALTELFRRKLATNPSFEIWISLLQPRSHATVLAANALNMNPDALSTEIDEMLKDLKSLRDLLPPSDRSRLQILTHDSLPMGSALMLDATATSGLIQVETKLYRSSRVESFSFEVVAPSPFYTRNFTAWNAVFSESTRV